MARGAVEPAFPSITSVGKHVCRAADSCKSDELSSGNPLYETYYRQVDSGNTGKVLASDAALFLKTSGLTDLILGKIWDLADTDAKGYLNKQEFYVALRLVACAQDGLDVSLASLNLVVPPPRFHDTGSPLLVGGSVGTDIPWAVKLEEKAKYDVIFDSLIPVNGFLSGEKVKPVLLNSKLPVDVLGRVWELSDIDHDGLLDRDEFAVAMFLVYCALEKEPVPMSLPPALVPPSKRKSFSVPGAVQGISPLPSPPSVKESHQSLPPVGILPTKAPVIQWVVSPAEKMKCDEIFMKIDKDINGYVSGLEVRDIFLKTGLPSTVLAHIWALCDTKDCGKLSKEQFALAFHFINQKLTKGIDPPKVLTDEMIPPSDRASVHKNTVRSSPVADFSAIKELDTLNNEIADLQREKTNVEQDLNEREAAIKERTSEVQDLQDEVEKESNNLQKLQAQKQEVQDILDGLDKQKAKLEEQLNDIRQKCAEESQLISSLKAEVTSQELKISTYEEELTKAKEELNRLQQETTELAEYVKEGKEQLAPLEQHLLESQQEINSMQAKLFDLKVVENHDNHRDDWHSYQQTELVNGAADDSSLSNSSSETANLNENAESQNPEEAEPVKHDSPVRNSPNVIHSAVNDTDEKEDPDVASPEKAEDPFDRKLNPLVNSVSESSLDFFQSDPFIDGDLFKDDPFGKTDPFGSDPFKGSDPFASDSFFTQLSSDFFASSGTDPFSTRVSSSNLSLIEALKNDPFAPGGTLTSTTNKLETDDPFATVFGSDSFGSGFADFSVLSKGSTVDQFASTTTESINNEFSSKKVFEEEPAKTEEIPPALPPKTGTPTRHCPTTPGKRPTINKLESSDSSKRSDPFQAVFLSSSVHIEAEADLFSDPFAPTPSSKEDVESGNFANFSSCPTEEDMIEWAKRESEREEKERLARLNRQEQEDLELAIALSKSEISDA
uniref:Epidermal growth factor receptor substrate 15 isoform X2 n=1 Tax=Geotrypetes seraphini TaxID=260995 RepID=A0A6P8NME0_GEOSA|nr:epidermal growth factor receptor substrate 15 isoform X2 [Geotrypetes seraphini]